MEDLMAISINDFIPQIFFKLVRRFYRNKKKAVITRLHPLNYLPKSVNPQWMIDIGANIGDISFAALNSFNQIKVICFEPVKSTFEILKNRLQPFEDRVFLNNFALSNSTGECDIHITSHHGANSIESQSALHKMYNPHVREVRLEKIKIEELDKICGRLPSNKIDILKIDVEGHELNVLLGGVQFIKNNVDIIIIEIAMQRDNSSKDQSFMKIFSLLESLGFCLINIYDVHNSTYLENTKDSMLIQMDCVFRKREYITG
jgi:FkbM family methyltransferase